MQNGFISRLIKGESLSRVLFIRVTCVYNNSVVAIAIPEVLTITGCATAVGQNDLGDGSSLSFMWLNYRNPHCHLLFNFQPYRLQSEQVKHKANSPPESRRSNSKASKATASSATGQSRGHSSRRYPSSLLGAYCVCVCLWVCTLSSSFLNSQQT